MAEDIKALLEKIHEEGIKAAEAKASQIKAEAEREAGRLIAQAKKEAERLIKEAKEDIAKDEQAKKALLAQAARDLLLELRAEINAMLGKIISHKVQEALSAEAIARIIAEIIKKEQASHKGDAVVALSKEDQEALEKGLLSKLKEEIKKGVNLRPSQELTGGFSISFDAGKSQFDFSDKALAQYLGNYVRPKLKELLEEAFSG